MISVVYCTHFMEITIILLLILLNGCFAMSEVALISARRASLAAKARQGNKSAARALALADNPDRFLSTVQIGITLIGLVTGIYSGETLAQDFAAQLAEWGVHGGVAQTTAHLTLVLGITYLTIVFGELVPKRMGLNAAERIAMLVAQPMHVIAKLTLPFVWLLSRSVELVTKLLKIEHHESRVTEDEIRSIVREGIADGEVQVVEQQIVDRVFSLGDRKVSSIMTHRNEMTSMDLEMSVEEIRAAISASPHTVYPVFETRSERLVGVVHLKDLFQKLDIPSFKLADVVSPAHLFHENFEVYDALEQLRKQHAAYGLVCDEYGVIQGIVTRSDVLEALVGALPDVGEERDIIPRAEGGELIDGQCPFYDFLAYYGLEVEQTTDYNTISGLVLDLLGHIPMEGEQVEWCGIRLEVVDMDGVRIDKLMAHRIAELKA